MRKIYQLLAFVFFATFLFLGVTACSSEERKDLRRNGEDFFVSMDVTSLRAHGEDMEDPGTTDPNTDTELDEDKVQSLRWILFPAGSDENTPAKFNHLFTAADLQAKRFVLKFKSEDLGIYDMIFIANEPSGKGVDSPAVTRKQLREIKMDMENISASEVGSGKSALFLMTANYENVSLNTSLPGSGTQTNPHRVDFTLQNKAQRPNIKGADRSAVELMRALAKMEITLKDIVTIEEDDTRAKTYSWSLPYGFEPNSSLEIRFKNMPNAYYLLPQKKMTDIPAQNYLYQFKFTGTNPDPKYVIAPPALEEPSIGGVVVGDYKIYVYLPEYLLGKNVEEEKQPGLEIVYKAEGQADMKSKFYPIKNAGGTHYDKVLEGLDLGAYCIYRNRLYKVNVKIKGKIDIWPPYA